MWQQRFGVEGLSDPAKSRGVRCSMFLASANETATITARVNKAELVIGCTCSATGFQPYDCCNVTALAWRNRCSTNIVIGPHPSLEEGFIVADELRSDFLSRESYERASGERTRSEAEIWAEQGAKRSVKPVWESCLSFFPHQTFYFATAASTTYTLAAFRCTHPLHYPVTFNVIILPWCLHLLYIRVEGDCEGDTVPKLAVQ